MIDLNKVDSILFDFGGTLDTNGIHWSVKFWEVYQKLNVPIDYELFREAYVNSEPLVEKFIKENDNFYSTLFTQISLQIDYINKKGVEFSEDKNGLKTKITKECYKDVISKISDIKQLLNSLKLDYKIGLVSNFYGNVKAVCKDLGIDSYFDVIVDSAEVKISKPDPKIFGLAIDLLKTTPGQTIVIGDSYDRDIVPAKKLGCKTIWLEGKSWKKEKNTVAADLIVNSLFEIENYFSEIKSNLKIH